ncbi:IclR family transcriptional regulator [Glaciihabitans tibetensis]|uniref:IclR family transcriptional regulator n=1 Tax=Glaciihabitans tibetensis TaxID=1266600 RepID=A0A2T0VG36_9MICO|nr:helix-turn-helix domain-containing protein [Glaciihabitans tibetensis]PRY69170.1 IclR family transcriptional regulator [Glaciihabitans tibetensis]
MRTTQWNDAVSVIDRVTLVLECFRVDDKRLGVSELARRANLPKSTVSRLVSELVEHRYLERDGSGIRLGLRLFELGELAAQPNALRGLALSTMADLRDATGQTVHLEVLDGSDVVCIGVLRGQDAVGRHPRVGDRWSADSTAAGRVMRAYVPGFGSVRDPGLVLRHDREGSEITCAASAILTPDLQPIAAIAISGPQSTAGGESVTLAVRTAAIALGRRLAARPPA